MKKLFTHSLAAVAVCSVFSTGLLAQTNLINEGFETGFPPTGWTVDNPDGLEAFIEGSTGKTGSKSAYIDIFNSDGTGKGSADALITPVVNMSSVTGHSFTFYYAYQMYTDPATPYTTADALSVYASTDGGATWNSIYNKSGNSLVTATPQFNGNAAFVPTASDWMMETVNVSSVATAASVQFKIEFINDWENNMYIDDIKLSGTSGGGGSVNEVSLDAFVNIFPNPSTGNFNVDISSSDMGQTDIIVYNMVGDEVTRSSVNVTSPKRMKFNIADQPNGLYFVKVKTADGSAVKKLVLNK